MSSTPIPNHIDLAIARLVEQYKGKQNLIALLSALVGPIQGIENCLNTLGDLRTIGGGSGITLDRLGALIGILREAGQSDADYRISLRAKIIENVSRGEPERLIQVYRLITGANLVFIQELFPATVVLSSDIVIDQNTANILFARIKNSIAAGVRLEGLISFALSDAFAFVGGNAGKGFGTITDTTRGGKFATLRVDRTKKFSTAGTNPNGGGFGSIFDPLVGGCFVGL